MAMIRKVLRTIYHTVEVSVKIQKLQRSGSCVMDQGKEVTKKKLNDCLEMGSLLETGSNVIALSASKLLSIFRLAMTKRLPSLVIFRNIKFS